MLQTYQNELGSVRVLIKDNEPMFCLKDICEALGLENPKHAINSLNEEFGKDGVHLTYPTLDNLGRKQNTTFITEAALYFLLMRSRKAEAKKFRSWICEEVLPSIRKHGMYATKERIEEALYNPESMLKIFSHMKELQDAKEALKQQKMLLEARNQSLESKNHNLEAEKKANQKYVSYAKVIEESTDGILIGHYAKILCNEQGIKIGQNKLFAWLREKGYLISSKGERFNYPYQHYIDNGYFCVKSVSCANAEGVKQYFTTKITGKGQINITKKLLKELKGECYCD